MASISSIESLATSLSRSWEPTNVVEVFPFNLNDFLVIYTRIYAYKVSFSLSISTICSHVDFFHGFKNKPREEGGNSVLFTLVYCRCDEAGRKEGKELIESFL